MKRFVTTFLTLVGLMLLALPAYAQEALSTGGAIAGLGAAVGMGIATFGGALGQGRTGAAAVEGIARNPNAANKVQTPMIIALAMTESLVLFAFVIMFLISGKVA